MNEWHDFFVATAGAAAALTGLIFVGVSISLARILSNPVLPNRALASIILLLAILIVSALALVPGQGFAAVGTEVLCTGIVVQVVIVKLDIDNIFCSKPTQYKRHYIINTLLNQIAVLPYLIGSIAMLTFGGNGLYWIVPAIIFSFIKAIIDAWILLIEINR